MTNEGLVDEAIKLIIFFIYFRGLLGLGIPIKFRRALDILPRFYSPTSEVCNRAIAFIRELMVMDI